MNEAENLLARVIRLEKQRTHLFVLGAVLSLIFIAALVVEGVKIRHLEHPQKLRVRELSVVDDHGVERVLIAAPLPEPMVMGQRRKRGGIVSGIIIADGTGTERGGYVTADGYANAFLTLDAPGAQTVLLLAEPDGSTLFRIWNRDRGSVTMGVSDNPFLNVKQNGKSVFATPADNPESRDSRPMFR